MMTYKISITASLTYSVTLFPAHVHAPALTAVKEFATASSPSL
jgi:hypothetical protein